MGDKYLEDIVEEDLKNNQSLRTSIFSRTKNILDQPMVRNPAITSTGIFFLLVYAKNKFPELEIKPDEMGIASYSLYQIIGLTKEYFLEGKKIVKRGLIRLILENPKIIGVMASIAGGITSYYAEENMGDLTTDRAALAVATSISFGLAAEASVRGWKNISRIKRSIRRAKEKINKRFWDLVLEHPLITSTIYTAYCFKFEYEKRASRRVAHKGDDFLDYDLLQDLTEHPGVIISMLMKRGIDLSLGIATIFLAGSLLHSQSIRENFLRTKKLYYRIKGDKEKEKSAQEGLTRLPNSLERIIQDTVELGNLYYEEDESKAHFYYRKALRLFSKNPDNLGYYELFRRTFRFDSLIRLFRREKKDIDQDIILLLNKDTEALVRIKEKLDSDPDNIEVRYIYGKALEILGYRKSGEKQKRQAVEEAANSKLATLRPFKGTKNKVVLLEGKNIHGEIVAKYNEEDKLRREEEETRKLRDLLIEIPEYDTPIPIGRMQIQGRICYVMEFTDGESLGDYIGSKRENLQEKVKEVAEFLGFIHANLTSVKKERSAEERTRIIRERLKGKLQDENLDRICSNLYPIFAAVENTPKVTNKDAHTGNWYIDEYGTITAIDIEADRLIPITDDTANLLDLTQTLTEKGKDEVLEIHINSYKKNSKTKEDRTQKQYHLAYLNSVVIRSLESYSLSIKHKLGKQYNLENARRAIVRIKTEHSDYYKENKKGYDTLEQELKRAA